MKATITINQKLCKSCGICVAFCPKKVLGLQPGKKAEVVDPEACIACRMCQLRCPVFAIEVIKNV